MLPCIVVMGMVGAPEVVADVVIETCKVDVAVLLELVWATVVAGVDELTSLWEVELATVEGT